MNRFRNPGPATSTRSSDSPSRSRTFSPSCSATVRGCSPTSGAISIAALEEKSPNSAFGGRSSVGCALKSWPATSRAALSISPRSAALGSAVTAVSVPTTVRAPPVRGPSVVVRLARQDLVRAIQLLQQHHARQLVRQRHRPERQLLVAVLQVDPARAAHDEGEVAAGHPAILEP